MFGKNYYCLVASLREYALDSDFKGFDLEAIRSEIMGELTRKDEAALKLLYGYYDCVNLIAVRGGRSTFNGLGLLSREEIEEALREPDKWLSKRVALVVRAFNIDEVDEDSEEAKVNKEQRFEKLLMEAYYEDCRHSSSRFLREWSEFDRTLRNITLAVIARSSQRDIASVVVGDDEITRQLSRSSAADFGLRGEIGWMDTVIATVNDEHNLLDKGYKIDMVRWNECLELSVGDYFDINALLAYLVRMNIVARWSSLDKEYGRQMFNRLISELDAKELINKQ